MQTVLLLLAISAFGLTIAEALGKCPGWIPKVLICIWLLLNSVH